MNTEPPNPPILIAVEAKFPEIPKLDDLGFHAFREAIEKQLVTKSEQDNDQNER
jgi:hypothetical protein